MMEKIEKILKKNKKIITIGLIISVIIAFLVHFLSWDVRSQITADGILGYIATMITAIATICLSYVAIDQAENANKISRKLLEIEESRYKFEERPFLLVENIEIIDVTWKQVCNRTDCISISFGKTNPEENLENNPLVGIKLTLYNTTQSFVSVSAMCKIFIKGELRNITGIDRKKIDEMIHPNKYKEVILYTREDITKFSGEKIEVQINLMNRFGEKYFEAFEFLLLGVRKNPENSLEEEEYRKYTYTYMVQNYNVKKSVCEENQERKEKKCE